MNKDLQLLQRDWDALARLDPLWAVLTTRGGRNGGWDEHAFFDTGEREIDEVLRTAAAQGACHGFGHALDFGCGVGRTARALSTRFREVDAVDISPEMLKVARRLNADLSNCAFRLNTSSGLLDLEHSTYNFIYSNIVLQHLPRRHLVPVYLESLIGLLDADGLLVFQLPYRLSLRRRLQPKRRLYAVMRCVGFSEPFLYRRARLNPMRTISLPRSSVEAAVTNAGGRLVHAHEAKDVNPSLFYYVRRR